MNIRLILLSYKTNFCVSLHYNEEHSYLFVNGVEIYKFKAKDSEIDAAPLNLDNVSKVFQLIILKRLDYMDISMIFQLIYNSIDFDNILDIHKCFTIKNNIK